jgi:ribonuclease-3
MNNNNLSELEEKIEYHFKDRSLLELAVTHTSYANEHRRENIAHNERIEFLGDAVLETVSSEYLYLKYPELGEGKLSKMRASMVCEPSLAIIAKRLTLPQFLRLGKGEEAMGGREKDSIT